MLVTADFLGRPRPRGAGLFVEVVEKTEAVTLPVSDRAEGGPADL